jgi:5-deoxy-glucuronate isomerase
MSGAALEDRLHTIEVAISLLHDVSPGDGHQSLIRLGEEGMQWLGLDLLRLAAGERWNGKLDEQEAVLVMLTGICAVSIDSEAVTTWEGLGGRRHVFEGPATAVYAPRRSRIEVEAESRLELAIVRAPCEVTLSPGLVTPEHVKVKSSGAANWRRDVRLLVPPGGSLTHRLIVGETITPPGNWSGIPPHKHDEIREDENRLEEFYLFKTQPQDGYAVQLVYDDHGGQGYIVGNNDLMSFPSSYHPTVAAPGVTVYYLWALAGQEKTYDVTIDRRFSWVGSTEAVLKELGRK